jgi:hypothetical protein
MVTSSSVDKEGGQSYSLSCIQSVRTAEVGDARVWIEGNELGFVARLRGERA